MAKYGLQQCDCDLCLAEAEVRKHIRDRRELMIPCWTALTPGLAATVEEANRPDLETVYGPAIKQILQEIQNLTEWIAKIDLRVEIMSSRIGADMGRLQERVAKLEKRHTLHRHWTEMGR